MSCGEVAVFEDVSCICAVYEICVVIKHLSDPLCAFHGKIDTIVIKIVSIQYFAYLTVKRSRMDIPDHIVTMPAVTGYRQSISKSVYYFCILAIELMYSSAAVSCSFPNTPGAYHHRHVAIEIIGNRNLNLFLELFYHISCFCKVKLIGDGDPAYSEAF